MRPLLIVTLMASMLITASATAQVVTTLHFGTVPPDVQCGQVWVESDIELYFTATTAEDCDGGGSCFFGQGAGSLWLYPSRLMVDLGQSYLVYRVEIDVADYCGVGCTKAFLYNGGSTVDSVQNTVVSGAEMLEMDLGAGESVDAIAVSSCEAEVLGTSITIYSAVVGTAHDSWGSVKALFR